MVILLMAVPITAQDTFTDKEVVDLANYIVELQRADTIKAVQIELLEQIIVKLKFQSQIDSLLLFEKDSQIKIITQRVTLYKELYDTKPWSGNKYFYYFYGISTILLSSWVVGNVR